MEAFLDWAKLYPKRAYKECLQLDSAKGCFYVLNACKNGNQITWNHTICTAAWNSTDQIDIIQISCSLCFVRYSAMNLTCSPSEVVFKSISSRSPSFLLFNAGLGCIGGMIWCWQSQQMLANDVSFDWNETYFYRTHFWMNSRQIVGSDKHSLCITQSASLSFNANSVCNYQSEKLESPWRTERKWVFHNISW